MSELDLYKGQPILDAEVIGETSNHDHIIKEVVCPRLESFQSFLDEVVDDPELEEVVVRAVAGYIYGARPSTEVAVRASSAASTRVIARPPLVTSVNQFGRQSPRYRPFITPLKAMGNDSALAFLTVVEKLNEQNERFGRFDSGPYYAKAFEQTKKLVSKVSPLASLAKTAVEARVSLLTKEQRRKLSSAAIGGIVITAVVTGTTAAQVRGRAPEAVVTTNISETQPSPINNPIISEGLKVDKSVIPAGDIK